MWYVLASAFFLLLWLLASGRVSLRLTTPKESARSTPAFLLWVCGLGLLAGGILMGVGERGVRARALGRQGRLSYAFDIMAPAAVVCGLFNLVLVCSFDENQNAYQYLFPPSHPTTFIGLQDFLPYLLQPPFGTGCGGCQLGISIAEHLFQCYFVTVSL